MRKSLGENAYNVLVNGECRTKLQYEACKDLDEIFRYACDKHGKK